MRFLKKFFESETVKTKTSRWKPQVEERYYYITATGEIDSRMNYFQVTDHKLFIVNNCFETAQSARESNLYKYFNS